MLHAKICRLCLKPTLASSVLKPEFNAILESLTSIKMNETGLNEACVKCSLNLKLIHRIQQNVLRAQEKLKKFPVLCEEIKTIVIKAEPMVMISETQCVICESMVEDNFFDQHIKAHFEMSKKCSLCRQEFQDLICYKKHLLNHPVNLFTESSEFKDCSSLTNDYNLDLLRLKTETLADGEIFYRVEFVETDFRNKPESTNSGEIAKSQLNRKRIRNHITKAPKKTNVRTVEDKKIIGESETVDLDMGDFPCDKCSMTFPSLEAFNKHPHGRKTCPICKKEISFTNISTHIATHTKSCPQICHYCGATYSSYSSLRGHIAHTHELKMRKCEECNVEFKNRQGYYKHHTRYHTKPNQVCEICGKSFHFKYALDKHMSGKHLNEKPFACEVCNQKVSGKYALKTHMRRHTNETPFRCEICTESFRQRVSLKNHLKSKHEIEETITARCKVCDKGFASRHALMTHMSIHGGQHVV